jgi:hypothetical protein
MWWMFYNSFVSSISSIFVIFIDVVNLDQFIEVYPCNLFHPSGYCVQFNNL